MENKTKDAKNLKVPDQISLLIEAINCDNENAARLLVHRAMGAASGKKPDYFNKTPWSNEDIDAVVALIRGIKPRDTVEAILAAQFISLHLSGMDELAQVAIGSKGQGVMLIRLSQQTLDLLQRYRGKSQTINVNYNVQTKGDTVLNTLIQNVGGDPKKGA